jgi:hypothetical protein
LSSTCVPTHPLRSHTAGMEDMTDAELAAVWAGIGKAIAYECSAAVPTFSEVVLNCGKFRNIAHAHFKVWFDAPDFIERMTRWPHDKRELQAELQELRRLMKLPTEGPLVDALSRSGAPGGGGGVELLVRGRFRGEADAAELAAAFGAFGAVRAVDLLDARAHGEGAVVVMESVEAACVAVRRLNLTKLCSNVMCKVKPTAAAFGEKAPTAVAAPREAAAAAHE